MNDDGNLPFQRDEMVDKPGIVGARWWQDGLAQADPIARRAAMRTLFGGAIAVAAAGSIVAAISAAVRSASADDYDTDARASLEMQREFGWNFGAVTESLVFDGISTQPFDRTALAQLADALTPAQGAFRPFFVPTLLQSLTAQRKQAPPGDPGTFAPLIDVMQPIFTPAMDTAYRQGRALGTLFDQLTHPLASSVGVVVDLPGPEAVAFAAGAASTLDPVFLLDNWPHPRGVVPSHLALAAAAYYQPLFAAARKSRLAGAPLFVLDRTRLSPYRDDASQFDNRYIARLPSRETLARAGVTHILYVVPTDNDAGRELDDLNEDFVHAERNGTPVRALSANTFGPATGVPHAAADAGADAGPGDGATYYYGYHAESHEWFWIDYPFSDHPVAKREPTLQRLSRYYQPSPRSTAFSSGASFAPSHPVPTGFGTVPVVVAVATGVVMGARMSRSGSWTRASGWGGG